VVKQESVDIRFDIMEKREFRHCQILNIRNESCQAIKRNVGKQMLYRTIWLLFDSVHRLVCGSFTKDHNVSETGSVSVLRWMGQGIHTQLGPSERTSLNHCD
jgi:hypothetical protein